MYRQYGKPRTLAQKILIITSLTLITSSTLAAEVYKWTDASGNIHYSDKKPNNSKHESLKVFSGSASSSRRNVYDQAKELDTKAETAKKRKEELEKSAAQKQKLEKQCQTIRDNLRTISESGRIKVQLENGETKFLSPEEIASRKQKHQQQLKDFCQ